MDEQTPPEQSAVDRWEVSKRKRAGQTCITLFVVFVSVVSVFSFGKAPFRRTTGTEGSRVDSDLISGLGVAVGLVAFVFLLVHFKRILRLSTAKKVLGVIGALGLIAHALLALFFPLSYRVGVSYGAGGGQPAGAGGNLVLARSGAEQWVIDGKRHRISSTYYLRLPAGLQFTIEYPYRFRRPHKDMNDERALEIVFPLMKHAYRDGLYKRTSIVKFGQGKLVPSRIGVTLVERQGGQTIGYRLGLSLDQIRKQIEQDVPPASTMPSEPSGGSR